MEEKNKQNPEDDDYKIEFDSDEDGLTDFEEENIYFTDPHNPDTDGDGMSDGDEVKVGRNPNGPGMLMDFFVPHAGNDYKPKSLHPGRLFFHALSAVTMKVVVFIFVATFPLEAWLTPDVALEQSKKIIYLTNQVRQGVGVAILKESSKLDQASYAKAQDMLLTQYFDHISPTKIGLAVWLREFAYNYLAAGENLAMGFADATDVVNAWTKSKTHYANLIDPDFTEIGVGMVTGPFKSEETTLVAQFFGDPMPIAQATTVKTATAPTTTTVKSAVTQTSVPKTTTAAVMATTSPAVIKTAPTAAASTTPTSTAPEVKASVIITDTDPPQVDLNKSKLSIETQPNSDNSVVRAEVYVSADTKSSEVLFENTRIPLTRDNTDLNRWTGQSLVFKDASFKKSPIALPVLVAEDYSGNSGKTDIRIDNITPNKVHVLDQYLFFKAHQSKVMTSLFDVSSFYFKGLLAFLLFSLLLNIFIEIRKQHPHIIASTLGLIGLLTLLIIF